MGDNLDERAASEAAAAEEEEAPLGFVTQSVLNEVLNTIDDCCDEALDYCLQEGARAAIGAAKAEEKAAELEQGIKGCHRLVKNALDKRMTNWELYCFHHCFTVPEGFTVNEDDNPCVKESHKDDASDSDLDAELDSLRRKLKCAYKESENLHREKSSLQRLTMLKRKIDPSFAEIQKLFEEKSVDKYKEDLVKAISKLQEKLMAMKKKRGILVYQEACNLNYLSDDKHLPLDKGCTIPTEDIQEVINVLQKV
ncbi:hypothetical protein ACP4OV_006076 [Aristida adscensionis]